MKNAALYRAAAPILLDLVRAVAVLSSVGWALLLWAAA
jgi:hypothetical protein